MFFMYNKDESLFLVKKMSAHNVYFSVQGVQDLFPDPLIYRGKADKGILYHMGLLTLVSLYRALKVCHTLGTRIQAEKSLPTQKLKKINVS